MVIEYPFISGIIFGLMITFCIILIEKSIKKIKNWLNGYDEAQYKEFYKKFDSYEEICKDEDCPKCKELPKVLRGKVKHKFPILTQPEIISVTKEELFSLTNPK